MVDYRGHGHDYPWTHQHQQDGQMFWPPGPVVDGAEAAHVWLYCTVQTLGVSRRCEQ